MSEELLLKECRRTGALEQQNRDLIMSREKLEREIIDLKKSLTGQQDKYRRRITNLKSYVNTKPYPTKKELIEFIDLELVD